MIGDRHIEREDRYRMMGLGPALIVVGIFLLIPIGLIAVYSFLEKGSFGGVVWSFSTEAYQRVALTKMLDGSQVINTAFLTVLARSVMLAALTTFFCLVISFPAAYYISRQKPLVKSFLILLVMFPFWSNLLVRTSAWIIILRDHGIVNKILMTLGLTSEPIALLYTNGTVLLGLIYVYLPFMILPIFTSVERLDKQLVEAAFDLYASRLRALWHVILPLSKPGMIAGSVLVFIPSLGAFITPDLLGGGRKLMLGSLIQLQFTTARNWPYGAALSIVLLILVIATLIWTARRHSAQKTEDE